MDKFININDVVLRGVAVFDENLDILIPLSDVRKALQMTPAADVVPKKQYDDLDLTLTGVMHFVDKWLDGDELERDEVNRAALMREKTLKIVEELKTAVVAEIFKKIEAQLARYSHLHKSAEEAYEVKDEYADGTPCEMTSIWHALDLHKKGWDDYETMHQLQENIRNIDKSRLLKEIEGDIAEIKKEFGGNANGNL